MKSPLKDLTRDFNCLNLLKQKIPRGSVVHSYLFYSGNLEFGLSAQERFVCAHTTKHVIYEFWECVLKNAPHIYEIVSSDTFSFDNENMFNILQERWPYYKDPYVRSALFFLLNRYSDRGLVSTGKMIPGALNPLCLATLKNFKATNFHLAYSEEHEVVAHLKQNKDADFILIPVGAFNYNLFEQGKNQGFETETINHQELYEVLTGLATECKWVLIYHYHPHLLELYGQYNLSFADEYGRALMSSKKAKEVIIANF